MNPKGVMTLRHLYKRCERKGQCMLWQLGSKKGRPIVKIDGKQYEVRGIVWRLAHPNEPLDPGFTVKPVCDDERCISRRHLEPVKRNQHNKGVPRPLSARAKWAATQRKKSALSDEAVEAIRLSDGPAHIEAAKHGIEATHVRRIRRNEARVDYSNPFLQLAMS